MAVAIAQTVYDHDGSVSVSSGTFTLAPTLAGSTIVVVSGVDSGGNFTDAIRTLTDDKGNTYQEAVSWTSYAGRAQGNIMYAYNVAAGTTTLSWTAGFSNWTFTIYELTGTTTTDPLDVVNKSYNNTFGSYSSFSLSATATANGAAVGAYKGATSAVTALGWAAGNLSGNALLTSTNTGVSAGTVTFSGTDSGSSRPGAMIAVFKAAGGGGSFAAKFRKTLSTVGTGVGKRQAF